MTLLQSNHIQNKISDYVLDLLSGEEKQLVSQHLAVCPECRAAVQQERQIGRLIHSTLNTTTRPTPARLQSLMPPIPQPRPSLMSYFAPYQQWAIACLLLVAMVGAFMVGGDGAYNGLVRQAITQPATVSFLNSYGTAVPETTRQADPLVNVSIQPEEAPASNYSIDINNPPAAPLPVAPQITPAPAATYFQ